MDNLLENFDKCIDTINSSSFIFFEKVISSLLKSVAATDFLTETITEELKSFSYSSEFDRARIPVKDKSGEIRSKLILPIEYGKCFTFITCLLLELDNGSRDPIGFLNEFFYAADTQQAFDLFRNEVLKAYSDCAHYIMASFCKNKPLDDAVPSDSNVYSLTKEDWYEVRELLMSLNTVKAKASPEAVIEFKVILQATVEAVEKQDMKNSGVLMLSLKHSMYYIKLPEKTIKELLKNNGIIKILKNTVVK